MKEDLFFHGIKGLIQNDKGKVLLLRTLVEEKDGTKRTYWDIPGGRIDRGETIEAALRREIREEIGIEDIQEFNHLITAPTDIRKPVDDTDFGLILSLYLCKIDTSNIELDKAEKVPVGEDRHSEFAWFSPEEAAKLVIEARFPESFGDAIRELS